MKNPETRIMDVNKIEYRDITTIGFKYNFAVGEIQSKGFIKAMKVFFSIRIYKASIYIDGKGTISLVIFLHHQYNKETNDYLIRYEMKECFNNKLNEDNIDVKVV